VKKRTEFHAPMSGGLKVYDALLIECARQSQADRIYTFNLQDFRRLAPDLVERLVAP
jgi:predicted nucleic acid-binding protein